MAICPLVSLVGVPAEGLGVGDGGPSIVGKTSHRCDRTNEGRRLANTFNVAGLGTIWPDLP